MSDEPAIIAEFDTAHGHYQVVDMVYEGRPARVLFSGQQVAAQSGIATDGKPDLLFDYNQRLFEAVTGINPQTVLIIGGGMYTLPIALLNALPQCQIDVVELDAELDDVAERFFDLQPDPRLTIVHADGLQFLQDTSKQYDCIVLDAYTHSAAEPTLYSEQAVKLMKAHLHPEGWILANVIAAYYGRRADVVHDLVAQFENYNLKIMMYVASEGLSLWLPQNLVLAAHATNVQDIDEYLHRSRLSSKTIN